jgi:hypothetical protein
MFLFPRSRPFPWSRPQKVNKSLFMFTKCKQTQKLNENKKTYSYSLGLDISLNTHNDYLLAFFKM